MIVGVRSFSVVLPCQVGDTAYLVDGDEIREDKVQKFTILGAADDAITVSFESGKARRVSHLGRTWALCRTEAEKIRITRGLPHSPREETGKEPPCRVGDTVYTVFKGKVHALEVTDIRPNEIICEKRGHPGDIDTMGFMPDLLGKNVFLSSTEAEKTLTSMNGRVMA